MILKKSDLTYSPIENQKNPSASQARFDLLRYNMSKVETLETAANGNGAFFVGNLPYGTYYLKETSTPYGYSAFLGNGGNTFNLFRLTVNQGGVEISKALKMEDLSQTEKDLFT